MLYMSSPIATSAIRTNRTNVVGVGLQMQSRINRDLLRLSRTAADAWEKKTEDEFSLWAARKKSCDATGVNDFYGIQQLVLISWLLSGDAFVLLRKNTPTELMPYSLRLHVVEADRISTPAQYAQFNSSYGETESGRRIYDGVEVDKDGSVAAYYICNTYPGEYPSKLRKWERVKAYGNTTGLPHILQVMDSERPEQYRGVSYLAQIIEPLLQMRRYTESELSAAVIESFFTAFIKTEADPSVMPYNETNKDTAVLSEPDDYMMGPGQINIMKPGESVDFADPKRPNNGFDVFVRAIQEQIGAALEIPVDLLVKAFDSSYSASRAALLEAWKAFKMRRAWLVSDFCQPVYEVWLYEAIARGRISAPGFFTDPLIHDAYLGANWIGPSQGQLDPVKEVNAEIKAISEGLTTREQATIRLNGGQWDSNVDQLARENKKLAAARKALTPTGRKEDEDAQRNTDGRDHQRSGTAEPSTNKSS